jgi:hypothetical protein
MVYPFTQTAEPALAVGFIATNYRHRHHMGKGLITLQEHPPHRGGTRHGARLAKCTSPDPRSSFTWERHRLLFGDASDKVYPLFTQMGKLKPG